MNILLLVKALDANIMGKLETTENLCMNIIKLIPSPYLSQRGDHGHPLPTFICAFYSKEPILHYGRLQFWLASGVFRGKCCLIIYNSRCMSASLKL